MPSLELHSSGPMITSEVTAVTSEATGFPIENAFDNNPDTFWRATSDADQTIDIDLGVARGVDALAIWLNNYKGDIFAASHTIKLYSDDNDDGNYSAVTLQDTVLPQLGGIEFPIQVGISISSTVTKRYWRIIEDYGVITEVSDLAGIWLMQKNTISKSSQLPRNDTDRFHNQPSLSGGGREFIRSVNSVSQKILPRTYLIEQSDFTALRAAHQDSRGRLLPLIAVESGQITRLVRFTSDDLGQNEISHEMYNPSFGLIELPYIPDGETF